MINLEKEIADFTEHVIKIAKLLLDEEEKERIFDFEEGTNRHIGICEKIGIQ